MCSSECCRIFELNDISYYFSSFRYQYFGNQKVSSEDIEKYGVKVKPSTEVTLEKVYEEMQSVDIDNWQQKRGPRPWEEKTSG